MVTSYSQRLMQLRETPMRWTITGVAGFIGSNLLEALLLLDQEVIGLDNFITGHKHNLADVRARVSETQWARFNMQEGDSCSLADCQRACDGAQIVLHQAALGSVPRSLEDPIRTNQVNVGGFLNMLIAARDADVRRFVYAGSSSTYGDNTSLPKIESLIGKPLSPYAVTKYVNELYADVFSNAYGLAPIGLRYFNVFGPRQDPEGPYAAVIPKWIASMHNGQPVEINGDGETSRDFCFISNVVQANILAGTSASQCSLNQTYNIALGDRTTLNALYLLIQRHLNRHEISYDIPPRYLPFRVGDVRHSQANIFKAESLLGYSPTTRVEAGIGDTVDWFLENSRSIYSGGSREKH